jgi:hypothetical protein
MTYSEQITDVNELIFVYSLVHYDTDILVVPSTIFHHSAMMHVTLLCNSKLLFWMIIYKVRQRVARCRLTPVFFKRQETMRDLRFSRRRVWRWQTSSWDFKPCSLVEEHRRFRGAYCLHRQLLLILDLSTRRGRLASVTPQARFTPGERTPRCPLDRRLGGPQSWSGHKSLREKILCLCRGPNLSRPVSSQGIILTELPQLRKSESVLLKTNVMRILILKNSHQPANIYIWTHTHTHTQIYIYIYIYIHTHTYIVRAIPYNVLSVLIQIKGPLNLCGSINSQFPIQNWISREEREGSLKCMLVYFGETSGKISTVECSSLTSFINK